MARKKSKKARKAARAARAAREVEVTHDLPGGFWRQVVAILMIVLAIVLVMTWFGSGGTILNTTHKAIMTLIGFSAYLVPALLIYLAVKIFRAENNRLSVAVWVASILMLLWVAGIAGIPTIGEAEATGGMLGEWLNNLFVQVVAPGVAVFVYLVLIFVTAIFILQISPVAVFKGLAALFSSTKSKEDAENVKILNKTPVENHDFKINPGVAMVSEDKEKKVEQKEKVVEPEKALVAISDPNWQQPPLDLLDKRQTPADGGNLRQNADIIKSTFEDFGINVAMEGANIGPKVTQYTMRPPASVALSKIMARDRELALNLEVDKIRIEAPIPGTKLVGVEVPNVRPAEVRLRGILESNEWKNAAAALTFAVGRDISGKAVVANLAKMPHLLIAGTTGSGKSVMTNTLISSLLYRNSPSDLKLIVVDPKQVEMAQYNDIPHLLTPVITATDKALSALKWAVNEMERRYSLMAEERVKNISDYNKKMAKKNAKLTLKDQDGNEQTHDNGKMPYIVIVIDEMADLMMQAGKDLELLIVRAAQKGRAAGIHLVLATQRPEAKVVTGLIKTNIPGRIAFAVGSSLDSRIMIDKPGAEKLLGSGDMLLLTTEMMGKPRRIQGAWASDEDVNNLTDYLREQRAPEYNDEVISQAVQIKGLGPSLGGAIGDMGRKYDPSDPLVRQAVELSLSKGKFSTSLLQTYLGKGHGFVSGLAIWLEEIGVIGPADGNKPRELLISSMEEFDGLVGQ